MERKQPLKNIDLKKTNLSDNINSKVFKGIKKINKNRYQYVTELKMELNKPKKLIEYFAIIGLDPKISVEKFLFSSTPEELQNIFSKELKPKIITKYPPINKSYVHINNNLCDICFPNGIKLEKFDSEPQPEIINYLLGNYFYSIEYPLKYVTCLKIYESFKKYHYIKKKIERESFGFINQISSTINYNNFEEETNHNPKLLKFSSSKIKSINRRFNSIKENDYSNYYIPKILCFISLKPIYEYQKNILLQIYDYYTNNKNNVKIPLEKIILNILCNIPRPTKGLNIYEFNLNENYKKIKIKEERMNKLNNIDNDLIVIFDYFSVDNFLEILKFFLYETKIVIFGSNVNHLCSFINGLISLIYPFTYPFQVSSIINQNEFEVLESISPYTIGINQKFYENFFKDNKIDITDTNILIIDLDNKKIKSNTVENIPNIPTNLYSNLKTKLENNLKNKNKNQENEIKEENLITYSFFSFFLSLMYNYRDYLNYDTFKNYKISGLKALFKSKEFIDSYPINERDFYKNFISTQMFSDFIFKKMIPKDTDDKLEILFFDENLNKINNKKFFSKNKPIVFLTSKEYEYKNTIKIPIAKPLSTKEKNRYKDKNYAFNSLLLGQEIEYIVEEKNSDEDDDNDEKKVEVIEENSQNDSIIFNEDDLNKTSKEFTLSYILFPKFNNDFFNYPSYDYFHTSSNNEIKRINTDLLAKSNINTNNNLENEQMLDYIYLLYIEVWGYSYWYQDIIEKDYRFEQMLEILDKIKHKEIEILNIIFESLNKFHEKEKIIRLYDKILEYNITPNNYIYSIIENITKKKNERATSFDSIKEKKTKLKFSKRSIKSEEEHNILSNYVSFNYIQKCHECLKFMDIKNITIDYKQIKKSDSWAKCPFCLKHINPYITINEGISLSSKYASIPCSKNEVIILESPYNLKNTLKEIIDREKINFLDIDRFKIKYPHIFWNCIWYFHLYNLDFSIILPYESNNFKPTRILGNKMKMKSISSKIKFNYKFNRQNGTFNNNIIEQKHKNKQIKYIVQNINSFFYEKDFCYDYFGIIKKSNIDDKDEAKLNNSVKMRSKSQ